MKLEQIAIYDSIEGYMEQIPVIKVKKGEYITCLLYTSIPASQRKD